MAEVLLHGDLDLWIYEGRSLPNMDVFANHARRLSAACRSCLGPPPKEDSYFAANHHHHKITSDPYVKVCLAGATIARTAIIRNAEKPSWKEHFLIPLAHRDTHLEFQVKDNDVFGAELIGTAKLRTDQIVTGEVKEGWFPVISPSSNSQPKPDTAILLRLKFTPFKQNPAYMDGFTGARNTYFPVRHGGSLSLYQDAHVKEEDSQTKIKLEGGGYYKRKKCWEDICQAILEAHHLIYIVGWSVYDKVRLLREPTPGRHWPGKLTLQQLQKMTLGELLKYKSQEGVRVCLLVWDDKTSHKTLFINTEGVMQTHDEDTRKFFKHSSVICVLSPRYGSSKLSIFKQKVVGTLFTHHQKCVLVDTQARDNNRKITAFLGGIDLCDGRYDTPEHRLFSDLGSVFEDDFHNPTFQADGKGPRQPWHDLHCKIEGPAAYDVLKNFEQRWIKATKSWEFGRYLRKVSHWRDDALIHLERISWILSPKPPNLPNDDHSLWVSNEDDPENWHIQVFRSIDSGSVDSSSKGFPKEVHQAAEQNLAWQKNLVVDRSIHTAYVQAIRSAKHFIYIENQYFLGSSYGWSSHKNAGANNLVPMELALKIANKIRDKERFAVYVVIPMWPEGVPTSASVQEILFWQSQTMGMMYEIIGKELKDAGMLNSHPQDYLNFYCLGNREELPEERQANYQPPEGTDPRSLAQKFRRFMIYVHAKGIIIDDEYVLLGSANINQRSLDGSRDTEIAMGAYQPRHTWKEKKRHPRGQVYGYRMSLWEEHLGGLGDIYKNPQDLTCVRTVNRIAEDNWQRYTVENVTSLQGHLLKYPINVGTDGTVGALPGFEYFPDVGGKVLGAHAPTLPDELTT